MSEMSIYVSIMYCLSIFGFFVIFFSFYLLIFVPTKLDIFTRFVIHGHDLVSGITQLYLTLGTTPTLLLPCFSGYTSGFLSIAGMSPLNQLWTQVAMITVSGSFSILLSINRAFAISSRMAKYKKFIIIIFFLQLTGQVVFLFCAGMSLEDGGKEARQTCLEKLPYKYPTEMYTFRGCDLSLQDRGVMMIFSYTGLVTIISSAVGAVCCVVLIQSIRKQAKSSQSTQFLANQRRITLGILYFVIVVSIGICWPIMIISLCAIFKVGSRAISDYAFISMGIYPIFGPYYVLMSNTDYRKEVRGIFKKAQELGTRTLSV